MPAQKIWEINQEGNRIRDIWMVPKEEARPCCVSNNIFDQLTEADFEGDYGYISEQHVYVDDEHWKTH